jgi:hypothetical protein
MRKSLNAVVMVLTTCTLVILTPLSAWAATPASSEATNGYRLSPVRTDLTISPGSSEVVTVYLQNASSAVENLQVIINDFEAPTNETGNPALLLNGATAPDHSLKQFTTVPKPTFTLQPNQQEAVNVDIKVPVGATSGGYYGAIRFAPIGATGNKNVNLSASIASLVLITVPGNLVEQLSIAGFGVSQGKLNASSAPTTRTLFFSNKNLSAVVRFQNAGNVQEQPFGKVLLKRGSTTLGTFDVNNTASPGNVLPDSIRLFSTTITKVGSFGKYKVEGNFGYGSKGQLLTAESTFYVIPITVIIILLLLILVIVFLIFGLPRLIRRYNRRVIARANRRR